MLEALERESGRLRGIAVIDADTADPVLARLDAAGVRGIRINELFRGGVALAALERLAPRVAELGWHVQLLIDARRLAEIAPWLRKWPVQFVFDHFGHVPAGLALKDPGIEAMLGLMAEGRAWVKLSASYRIAADPGDPDLDRLAQRLLQAAPSRCLWASDWPHVGIICAAPALERLGEQLARWLPDPALRRQVLVDNPARLYRFTDTSAIDGGDSKP
jgi:predicted TIM-barrel fold metal-dependent hydrolase